jgi:hypothetical protein
MNGFRNIQTLIRKLKTASKAKKSPPFDFVEVMACPSGEQRICRFLTNMLIFYITKKQM